MGRRLIPFVALCFSLPACTSAEDGPDTTMAEGTGSFGVVRIGQRSASTVAGSRSGTIFEAVFVRYGGLEGEQVLELLGLGRPGPFADECVPLREAEAPTPPPDARVELLDVGTIDVRVAGSHARLRARTFPELGSLVAGAFYAGDAPLAWDGSGADELQVIASGSDRMAPFEVVAPVLEAPRGVTVAGMAADEKPVLGRQRDVEVVWDAGDPRDRIDLHLVSGGRAVECSARDDGMLVIPAELLAHLSPDAESRLLLRRVRVQPFDARGWRWPGPSWWPSGSCPWRCGSDSPPGTRAQSSSRSLEGGAGAAV